MNTFIVIGIGIGIAVVLLLLKFVFRKDKTLDYPGYQNLYLMSNEELKNKVREYLSEGKKIEAIKYVHEKGKTGLLEAKTFIEELEKSISYGSQIFHKPENLQTKSESDNAMAVQINQLLSKGNKIQAIKLVVEKHKLGLKQAKDYIDALEQKTKNGQI